MERKIRYRVNIYELSERTSLGLSWVGKLRSYTVIEIIIEFIPNLYVVLRSRPEFSVDIPYVLLPFHFPIHLDDTPVSLDNSRYAHFNSIVSSSARSVSFRDSLDFRLLSVRVIFNVSFESFVCSAPFEFTSIPLSY